MSRDERGSGYLRGGYETGHYRGNLFRGRPVDCEVKFEKWGGRGLEEGSEEILRVAKRSRRTFADKPTGYMCKGAREM